MEEEKSADGDRLQKELVTITTAITPVIVKAVSTNLPDIKTQRTISEPVQVIAQNPNVQNKTAINRIQQTTSPVIVKNTNSIIVQNFNRNIILGSSQSVIKSTKSEEWKLSGTTSNSTNNIGLKVDGDVSNDSSSFLTAASDNSMDSVITTAGTSTQSNEKTENWNDTSSRVYFDDNEDSRDSKTEDVLSNSSSSQKETSRDARNKAEKQRRDKLNRSITELSTLVPLVNESSRKIDKTGVLRLTAHELRKEYVFGDSMVATEKTFSPSILNVFINWLDGCIFTTTCKGIIVVISPNIENYLGHCQTDLLGTNILNLCHPDDVEILKHNLMPHEVPLGIRGQLLPNSLSGEEFTKKEKQRIFHVRLARSVPRSEPQSYEVCKIMGYLRRSDKAHTMVNPPVRRQRSKNEETVTPSGNDVVFIGVLHPVKEHRLNQRLLEASKEEYRTRHLTDGRIISCDQRISVVAGYLTSEVNGVSAFTFIHKDDVRWVIIALRQMYDANKKYGESWYRLVTKTGEFIYMKTTGYLEVGNDNDVQSFVCVNSRISEKEGKYSISQMKHKYGVIFDGLDELVNIDSNDEAGIEDPAKLEQAIVHLITNLPTSENLDKEKNLTKTLSIITPNLNTIKLAIERSFNVLGKPIIHKEKNKSDSTESKSSATDNTNSVVAKITDDFSSNSYLTNVISKMDLFSDKKDQPESPSFISETLIQLPDSGLDKAEGGKLFLTFPTSQHTPELLLNLSDGSIIETSGKIVEDQQDIHFPSTSHSIPNNQNGIFTFDLDSPQFLTTTFEFTQNDKESLNGTDANVKHKTTNKSDPLIGSVVSPERDKLITYGHKRTIIDHGDSLLTKRRAQVQVHQPSEILNVCESMFHTFNDNVAIANNDSMTEGFDQFIDELTDPNSDLSIVVPRTLVALESSITEIDGTVTHINPIYSNEQQINYSDIIDTHSENKNILENIQNEHRSSGDVNMGVKKDI